MIVSRFVFMPLKALIDLEARTVETCNSIATGRAILDDEWHGIPRVDFIAADEWQVGPAFITREQHPRKRGVAFVLHVGPRDLYTVTAAIAEVYLMRDGKLPSCMTVMKPFYGNPDSALRTMIATACGLRIDPAITAFAKRAYAADPARWDGIRAAAARHRIGHGRIH
ncbi:hypothetical protein [Paracoccus alkenifer]|uniref:Uncharacterized protein n=1 Tax=Paracoccus alkenifer TaxID=65735 RepID=A0A1H6MUR2_9RHOB|nr:hypothetical protein [Paracoccus alkenifer]SEI03442.1 hypothetical protein SAMN04488075_2333 [Paracoccus alkenifer]